jgi:Txe/YoeB family toxin of Txe-Axe toxin-antitoxin module
MIVAGKYSFNDGEKFINKKHKRLLNEIYTIISNVDANEHKKKRSKEKTMRGRTLFSPNR